jgi:hypothetical protein
MKNQLVITYFLLIILTISTALLSNFGSISPLIVNLIMLISALKFLLVAFQFMELKKANSFWKISLISVLVLIILVIVFI